MKLISILMFPHQVTTITRPSRVDANISYMPISSKAEGFTSKMNPLFIFSSFRYSYLSAYDLKIQSKKMKHNSFYQYEIATTHKLRGFYTFKSLTASLEWTKIAQLKMTTPFWVGEQHCSHIDPDIKATLLCLQMAMAWFHFNPNETVDKMLCKKLYKSFIKD